LSNLPQTRRFLVEDFIDQKDWIAKLFTPLNQIFEGVFGIINRGITIKDNMLGDVQTVQIDYVPTVAKSFQLAWALSVPPRAIHVGNIQRANYDDFTISAAVQVQWKFDSKNGLRLTNIVGVTPSNATQYLLTLIIFAG
jgi:hypothetical protein